VADQFLLAWTLLSRHRPLIAAGVKLVVANALLAASAQRHPNARATLSTVFPIFVALLDAHGRPWRLLGLYML